MSIRNKSDRIPTPTVGDVLQEEFLEPLEITPYRLAKEIHVSTSTILDLVHGRRRVSVDMALKLSRFFSTSERFWLNLQNSIDIRNRKDDLAEDLEQISPIRSSA